jgi:hypothetical protein
LCLGGWEMVCENLSPTLYVRLIRMTRPIPAQMLAFTIM